MSGKDLISSFSPSLVKNNSVALFLIIGLMAFWCLTFVLGFAVPYWLTIGAVEMLRPKRLTDEEVNS